MSTPISTPSATTPDSGDEVRPITIGSVSEIPDNGRGLYTVNGVGITVFNVDGELYAIENSCPHMGGPLGEGKLLRTAVESTNPVSRFREFHPGRREPQESATPTTVATRLTIGCPYHGWEFDLADGTPVFPAKRGVRTYPVRVEDGLIKLDIAAEPNRAQAPG